MPPRGDALALAQHATAHALGIAMQNAVACQQMMNVVTVAIAAQLGGARGEDQVAALRTTLEVLKAQDPVGQMAQLTELLGRLQEMREPSGTPPPVGHLSRACEPRGADRAIAPNSAVTISEGVRKGPALSTS